MAGDRASTKNLLSAIPVAWIVIAVILAAGGAVFLSLERRSASEPEPARPATADAKAYVQYLRLRDVEMQAHESYLRQSVTEIVGKIANNGNRSLKRVEINCVFYDAYGQVVLRERVPLVGEKTRGLAPGEIKNFRLAFDNIPESWNQAMPQLVIAEIVFG